jgi:ribosome maturation factor RimP
VLKGGQFVHLFVLTCFTDMAVFRNQTEEKVFNLINDRVEYIGFSIVRVRAFSLGRKKLLQIMIENNNGSNITSDNCEQVSKNISILLDKADIISSEYILEVSSPGLDRPLTRIEDFVKYQGHIIKLSTFEPIDGRRKFCGKLVKTENEVISLELKHPDAMILLNYNNIDEAFLQYFDSDINSTTNKKGNKKK